MTFASPVPLDGGIFSPLARPGTDTEVRYVADMHAALRHPSVRDLAWLLQSPALLSSTCFPDRLGDPGDRHLFGPTAADALSTLLHRLDADPRELDALLAASSERRLGRYAERLLGAWLERAPGVSVTALNLPVRSAADALGTGGARRTLGECDALFETCTGMREHWEMAVKFYLYVDDGTPSSTLPDAAPLLKGCGAFVGAGLADRLDVKLQRMIEHQLPLSAHPELLAVAPGPWDARLFVKGRLFYPLADWRDLSVAAPALAPDHARGWWATIDTWLAWSRTASCHWTHLARLDWLAPLHITEAQGKGRISDASAFAQALRLQFESDTPAAQLPQQVAALSPALGGEPAYELSRGFIVPSTWPASAMRFLAERHRGNVGHAGERGDLGDHHH